MVSQGHEMGEPKWGMWPAGTGRSSPRKPIVDVSEVRGNAAARPLSADIQDPSFLENRESVNYVTIIILVMKLTVCSNVKMKKLLI